MAYTDLGLTVSAPELYQRAIQRVQDTIGDDSWQPSPAEQLVYLVGAMIGVEITVIGGQVPDDAIAPIIGQKIFRIMPLAATPATGTVTLHMTAAPDDVIAAGSSIDIDGVGFHTDDPVTIAAGQTTATANVTADEAGTGGNDLAGASVTLTSPSLVYVDTVTLDAPTGDGTDGETATDYLDRFVEETPTMSPKALYVSDFEAIARRNPLVGRALAVRFYNPGPPVDDAAAGHVTVFLHGLDGNPVDSTVKDEVLADLGPDDIVAGPIVHLGDGTYTIIDVSFTALCVDTADPTLTNTSGEQAVSDFLASTSWGRPPGAPNTEWDVEDTVKRNDLIGVVYSVQDVRHVQSLTLRRRVSVTGDAATDVLTSTAHGFADDDPIEFVGLTGGAPLVEATTYYVRDSTTDTFKVTATVGGTAIDLTTDLTAGTVGPPFDTADITLPGPAPLTTPGVIDGTVTLT